MFTPVSSDQATDDFFSEFSTQVRSVCYVTPQAPSSGQNEMFIRQLPSQPPQQVWHQGSAENMGLDREIPKLVSVMWIFSDSAGRAGER